jgi:signal transduction histidine kinase
LEIQDDGCGFKVPDHWLDFACQGHWGLLGMAERVEAIGGHFQVASLPGAGTRLQVTVPLTSSAIGV